MPTFHDGVCPLEALPAHLIASKARAAPIGRAGLVLVRVSSQCKSPNDASALHVCLVIQPLVRRTS